MTKQEVTVFAVQIPESLKHVFKGLALDSRGTVRVLFTEPNTFVEIETSDAIPVSLEPVNIGQGLLIRKLHVSAPPLKGV